MTVQSKLVESVCVTCHDFQHPWTDKCVNAAAGILLSSTPYCLRVYTVVYALSLVMRNRIPTLKDLKQTIWGILQSTGFLVTNAYTFILYNCLLRNILGHYHFLTVAFVPCFLAAFSAILVERPARRPLLTLYVANVATETLWNMAEARGLVRSVPHGQTLIFGVSVSVLLYLYRLGMHENIAKDAIFNILRIFVGKEEAGPVVQPKPIVEGEQPMPPRRRPNVSFNSVADWVRIYTNFIRGKHSTCLHKSSCMGYTVLGGLRPLLGGVALQMALKLVMNIKSVVKGRMDWRKQMFNRKIMQLGCFMGSFSFIYKALSCLLRHSFNYDDARFAIPAGLLASLTFTMYPDNTVALYVMWKALQILYNIGVKKGKLPHIPHSTLFLYPLFTAVLFHAGIMEAKTLRPSYYKFLQAISGERLSKFDLSGFDSFGLKSHEQALETCKKLKIIDKSPFPIFPLSS